MKKPKPTGTPIDNKRYKRWTDLYGSYRLPVTRVCLEEWVSQFKKKHRDLAARVLDSVLYIEITAIAAGFRQLLSSMDGWSVDSSKRKGRWFFVAMSGSAGESGDLMLREFRRANHLNHQIHNSLFITRSELVRNKLTIEDTVVLIDDFSGTGTQVCDAWNNPSYAFSELTAGAGNVFLIVVAATNKARKKIETETSLQLISSKTLTDHDDLFSDKCSHFTQEEKDVILDYCNKADKKNPRGFGQCGLLVVFNHGCPNNSIPILHAETTSWTALFPRQS